MTPKERMGAFLTGQPLDFIPTIPLILNWAAPVAGMTVGEHCRDGLRMGQAHVATWRRFGQDMITVFTDTGVIAESMGTLLHYSPDDAARIELPLVQQASDVDRIIDADPRGDNGMRTYLEAVEHCVSEVGDEVFVGCCFAAPFTTAAGLRGTDVLARDLRRDPGLAREILDRAQVVGCRFIEACARAGGVPAIVDPVATGSMLSPALFEQFAQPYLAAQVEVIHAQGLPALVHVCGKTHMLLDLLADTGADILSLDIVDLAEARDRIGHRTTLMGNVPSAQVLLEGTAEQIEAAVIKCFRDAGNSPRGFILATGCEVPLRTPIANMEAYMAASRRWGRLPLELPQ